MSQALRSAFHALLLTAVLAASAARAEMWTIDRAVATALEHSPDARLARARVDGAQALVDQARSAWMPQLKLSGGYTETNSPMPAFGAILNQRAFTPGLDFNHPGRIDNLNATGTLAYNLYAGGRATAGREAARAGADAADSDLRAAQQQLTATVVKAALDLRRSRETLLALDAAVRAYDATVAVARARFDAGQLLKADLLALEVQLAETREKRSSARHGAALAVRAFRFTLGLDASDEPVEIADDDPALVRLTAPDTRDVSHRPELLGLQARLRAAEALVEVARGARRPTVNAFASYQVDQGWELRSDASGWLAGVAVNVDVFDGGQTSGKIRQARAEAAQAREQLRRATLAVALEAEQARLAHADAAERLAVATGTVAQADEAAALTRARFEQQSVLTADVIGAESRLLDARLRRTFAATDERLALVELRRSLGLAPLP